jgi:Uma2 family endonuclease
MRERMGIKEIVLPETKPALEWVSGRVMQKVSPQRRHALAQRRFAAALGAWADGFALGEVGTEWECRIAPPGQIRGPLVPDVTFLSYSRVSHEDMDETDIPRVAPDAVVEIISPGDQRSDIEEKIGIYLACGTNVVFLVDTKHRTVTARDATGAQVFDETETVVHPSLPGFAMSARLLFESPKPL